MIVRNVLTDSRRRVWVWAVLLGALAVAVKLDACAPVDERVTEWLLAQQSTRLDTAAAAVTFFGSSPWIVSLLALLSAWWWRRQRRIVGVLWATFALALLLQAFLRLTVGHVRPDAVFVAVPADLRERLEVMGFTSGHAFRSAFLYGWWVPALLRRGGRAGILGAIGLMVLIGLVGVTRIYLYRHWMTDVLGGWLVALIALSVAFRWSAARERVPVA